MKRSPFSRRLFLQGAGGFSLALPFLPSLTSAQTVVDAFSPKKKFISFGSSLGVYPKQWWPQIEPKTDLGGGVYSLDLTSISGDLSPVFTNQYYGDLKSKIMFLRGMDLCWNIGSHASTAVLSAELSHDEYKATMPTIDSVMANSSIIYPTDPLIRNLVLHPLPYKPTDHPGAYTVVKGANGVGRSPVITSDKILFDTLFGSAPVASATSPSADEVKNVVDKVYDDYSNLKNSRKISSEDRRRLDDHLSYLFDVGKRILNPPKIQKACTPPILRPHGESTLSDWDACYKNMMDLMVLALSCGATRIGAFSFGGAFFRAMYGNNNYHPEVSHSATNVAGFLKVHSQIAKYISYFIHRLDEVQDTDGKSLLYNSIVLSSNSLGFGDTHCPLGLPVFVAGNAGGDFTPGRMLCYRRRNSSGGFTAVKEARYGIIGRPYNQFLCTVMQSMGLKPEHYEIAGNPGYGTYSGPYVRPVTNSLHAPYKTTEVRRSRLPGLKVA